ncbi:hypothetical protein ACPA9J_03550 [Pseudomonas aeruginosa]
MPPSRSLFGVQQLLEGMLWLTFPDRARLAERGADASLLVLLDVLWPI